MTTLHNLSRVDTFIRMTSDQVAIGFETASDVRAEYEAWIAMFDAPPAWRPSRGETEAEYLARFAESAARFRAALARLPG